MSALIAATLLADGNMVLREQALLRWLAQLPAPDSAALIIEGLPAGYLSDELPLRMIRLSPACLCCAGNLVLKVNLNRLLRQRPPPQHLIIALHDADHLPQLRKQLLQPEYLPHLQLQDDILLPATS